MYISSNKKIWDEALLDFLKLNYKKIDNFTFQGIKLNHSNISKKFSVLLTI